MTFTGFYIGDKDKSVNFNEFLTAFVASTDCNLKEKVRYTFRFYDKNLDEKLDRNEVRSIIKVLYHFLEIDSEKERKQYMGYETCVNYVMKHFDENNDNEISFDEFIKHLMDNEILCGLLTPFNDADE